MNHWVFVSAAYFVSAAGIGGLLLWAWLRMRKAEARLDAASER